MNRRQFLPWLLSPFLPLTLLKKPIVGVGWDNKYQAWRYKDLLINDDCMRDIKKWTTQK